MAAVSGQGANLREAEQNMEETKEEATEHGFIPDIGFSV